MIKPHASSCRSLASAVWISLHWNKVSVYVGSELYIVLGLHRPYPVRSGRLSASRWHPLSVLISPGGSCSVLLLSLTTDGPALSPRLLYRRCFTGPHVLLPAVHPTVGHTWEPLCHQDSTYGNCPPCSTLTTDLSVFGICVMKKTWRLPFASDIVLFVLLSYNYRRPSKFATGYCWWSQLNSDRFVDIFFIMDLIVFNLFR